MPSLTFQEIQTYCTPNKPRVFIETGTHMGDTINNVLNHFDKIYSIELSPTYAGKSQNRFKDQTHVTIINGDSAQILVSLCKIVQEPAFFWLDGHWSGGDTAQGSKDCPLLEEVKAINDNLMSECTIAIDDIRLFGTKQNEDWLDITREAILNIVKDRLVSCKYYPSEIHPEDRMVIQLNSIP
jgi:hypothetical protein